MNVNNVTFENVTAENVTTLNNTLNALKDIGFDGFLAIEREVGENPEKDIKTAMTVLNGYLSKI